MASAPPRPGAAHAAVPADRAPGATIGGARRILGLDVVRACAIGLVMVSHVSDVFAAFWGRRPPAFVSLAGVFGVELFFVLSGFLIGTLLIRAAAEAPGWRGWRAFMLRRWLRTLPLYVAWILLMAAVWPPADGRVGWHLARYLSLTQNLAWRMPADNWFGVSWSLAVEEWFYLSFSLPLLLLARRDGGRRSLPVLAALFVAVPVLTRCLLPAGLDFGQAVYKVTAFRLDSIAYGVLAALLATRRPSLLRHWAALLAAGLAIVLFVWVQISGAGIALPGLFYRALFLPLLSAGFCLCLPAALRLRHAPRWLARPAVWLSTRSYGLYVVHLTVLEVASGAVFVHAWPKRYAVALALVAAPLLAELSWRLLERPMLALRPAQPGGHPAIPSPLAPGDTPGGAARDPGREPAAAFARTPVPEGAARPQRR